jgi:hypothetical protein
VTYLRRDAVTGAASPLTLPMTLAPHSRTTIDVAEVSQAGPNQDVSTVVAANGPIAVERPLYFSGVIDGTIKGGHDSFGVSLT